jgi:hypothetical protein
MDNNYNYLGSKKYVTQFLCKGRKGCSSTRGDDWKTSNENVSSKVTVKKVKLSL